jgi:rhodanese-related sulfurtransferase
MIVGFVGFIGAGKDTAADYLVNCHGFRRDSFANSLKDAVANVFGWDRVLLEGRTKEAREWREQKDEWWSDRLGMNITPRMVLQQWGTEVVRNGFHDDMWIASLENKMRQTKDDIVISDVRFPNEIKAIHNAGGIVIRVKRGSEPKWYEDAINYNAGVKRVGWALGRDQLEKAGVHASEYSWVGGDIDFVVNNDTTIDDLFNSLEGIVLKSQVPGRPVSRAA